MEVEFRAAKRGQNVLKDRVQELSKHSEMTISMKDESRFVGGHSAGYQSTGNQNDTPNNYSYMRTNSQQKQFDQKLKEARLQEQEEINAAA